MSDTRVTMSTDEGQILTRIFKLFWFMNIRKIVHHHLIYHESLKNRKKIQIDCILNQNTKKIIMKIDRVLFA